MKWEERSLGDPQEALRVKIIEMLGSEGPKTSEEMVERLPFPQSLIERNLHDKEDLMHKAMGWMLRETGKVNLHKLNDWLEQHHAQLPRTLLRYAIERHPTDQRQQWLLKT